MSIDNKALIIIGKYYEEIPQSDNFDDAYEFVEFFWNKYPKSLSDKLDFHNTSENVLIGYKIADSGSYGTVVLPLDLPDQIENTKNEFRKIFNLEPQVYLINYQY